MSYRLIYQTIFSLMTLRFTFYMLLTSVLLALAACGGSKDPTIPPPAACAAGVNPVPGLVVTKFGAVQGSQNATSYQFLGIPYAAPPVADLRWQPPQDPVCEETIRIADTYPAGCMQKHFDQMTNTSTIEGSEDCLYLNVWTPQDYTNAHKPVMVFIHGGANQQGSTAQFTVDARFYEGAKLAARGDVVVVTLDYRLGPLGYLNHPSLIDTGGHYGNWGLLDQIHALHWVQQNIAEFGGDPERVLLFGESAGAVNTCMLMTSPLAAGLFSRAAMESGACIAKTQAEREVDAEQYLIDVGCNGMADPRACMMALDGEALVTPLVDVVEDGLVTQDYGPSIDGWVLPQDPMQALQSGEFNHVPLIIGTNFDETSISAIPNTINRSMVLALISVFDSALQDDLLALYDPGSNVSLLTPSPEARTSLIRLTSDSQFICQSRRIASLITQSPAPVAPVYRYTFNHRLNGIVGSTYGAYHAFELFYVFQTIEDSGYASILTADDTAVEEHTLGYWTRFAATGNPNNNVDVIWPEYGADDPYLEITASPLAGNNLLSQACDVWDKVVLP